MTQMRTAPRFLVVGAGGLGGPVALALTGAGADRVTVCDPDRVELSNLHRQPQFATGDLGRLKVAALADRARRIGLPAHRLHAVPGRLDPGNADALIAAADVVVEGSDDLATKFLVNDRALAANTPVAIGGIVGVTGQLFTTLPGRTACYRCLFEEPPVAGHQTSCSAAGVLGPAVAHIAGELAIAALSLAAGAVPATPLTVYPDLLEQLPARAVDFAPRPDCPACAAAARTDARSTTTAALTPL